MKLLIMTEEKQKTLAYAVSSYCDALTSAYLSSLSALIKTQIF